jgi:hypothetical protein
MDGTSFDRLTRLMGATGPRRAALGSLLGFALLGVEHATAKQKRRKGARHRIGAAALPGLRDCPNPKAGQNLTRCDFSLRDLRAAKLNSTNLTAASFARANLCQASLRSANLAQVDFTRARLFFADLRGTNLSTANLSETRFCQTIMPNGKINDANCSAHPDNLCCFDAQCPPHAGIPQVCGSLNRCCFAAGTFIGPLPDIDCCSGFKSLDDVCL